VEHRRIGCAMKAYSCLEQPVNEAPDPAERAVNRIDDSLG
jgi:hypothetical protein